MIITDLLEYVGKYVKVTFEDGTMAEGKLEYIQSYSEMNKWKRPKHFYISFEGNKECCFRSWHVKTIEEIKE